MNHVADQRHASVLHPMDTKHYMVATDFDVVVLRQALRGFARALDLSLVQQARITAAISDIARTVLAQRWRMVFTMHVHAVDVRRALTVVCQTADQQPHPSSHEFAARLNVDSVRQLLDEAIISASDASPVLTVRIWV